MKAFFIKYWFFLGIILVLLFAFLFPAMAGKAAGWNVISVIIALAFFITGLQLETHGIIKELRVIKAPIMALVSIFVFFPLIAFTFSRMLFENNSDYIVGVSILATAPATVVSGTVMTAIAGGSVPLSLFICVASNLLAIFTIPISLNALLSFGEKIELPITQMLGSLFVIVLLPILLGQMARGRVKSRLHGLREPFSIFSRIVVLCIIFNAVSASASRVVEQGSSVAGIVVFSVFLHALMLVVNFWLAKFLRLSGPAISAFTIHGSQKTLTVSYVVWSGYFAATYPLAMIPVIAYHLAQMIIDTFVAHWFSRKLL